MKKILNIKSLKEEAKNFCMYENNLNHSELLGVTDGKAIGTFIEHRFKEFLSKKYSFTCGSSSSGIDFPDSAINTDIKITSIKNPQSSCPYENASQKIYGLGYNLLIFVYDKIDDMNTSRLNFLSVTFVKKERTADYTTTIRILEMLKDGAIKDDIVSYLNDKNIPGDETAINQLAERIMNEKPTLGYLTISNALQWRLKYSRVLSLNNEIEGVETIDFKK